jgi:dTDP-glucose 4,6-dehydratase
MNILVTGGAGFIGSHFVLRHKEKFPDDTIVVLDALTYAGKKEYLNPVINRIRFVQGDIADIELVSQLVLRYEIDTIVNFAAETHVDRSIQSAVPFIHSNVVGVQSLLEVCRASPSIRLLHISTDEVHGDVADDERARTVEDPLLPSSPYAASKAAAEMFVLAAMRTYGIRAAITRCTNNFGPHQAQEKFIPTIIRNALVGTSIPVYGQGLNKRDWLYVTDHCDALETILATPGAFHDPEVPGVRASQPKGADHIFHIAADSERQNIEVVKTVLKILGKSESLITYVQDRPGHDWRYALDASNTRALGWKPAVSFEEGIRQTIDWYRHAQ